MELTEPILKSLIQKLHTSVVVVIWDIVKRTDVAEDIAMIMWQIIWERKDKFESVDKVKAFLYIAAKNMAFTWKKGERIREAIILTKLRTEQDIFEVEQQYIANDTYTKSLKVISENFPAIYFCIFTSTMQGKSNTQIAKELGINGSTVTSARSRIMNFLRQEFGQPV